MTIDNEKNLLAIATLGETINTGFNRMDERFDKIGRRFDQIDQQFEKILEQKNFHARRKYD